MNFNIPALGTQIKLTQDWTFRLYHEHRNFTLMKSFGIEGFGGYGKVDHTEVTMPKGTILSVDRLYIRQFQDSYNSVTFRVKGSGEANIAQATWDTIKYKYHDDEPTTNNPVHKQTGWNSLTRRYDRVYWREEIPSKAKAKPRFWVKLEDANKIEFEAITQ